MPELPEVETVRRGLAPSMEGAVIDKLELRRADLRFPFPDDFARRLRGRRILRLGRRAKYLLAHLDGQDVLVMHLGMSGRFRAEGEGLPPLEDHGLPAHDHVLFHLNNGRRVIYNDVRRFGYMTMMPEAEMAGHKLFRDIGPEPLGNNFHADHLAARAKGRKTQLKAFLLDQKTVAGLGNIYVCEALFRAGLSPQKQAAALCRADGKPVKAAERLCATVREVLQEAIEAGGSSLRDHRQADGELGYFQHNFQVYGREGAPCRKPGCEGEVARMTQQGRSTFYCKKCQK